MVERGADGIGRLLAESVRETLWPTRCAVCDAPGRVLCEACDARLEALDLWQACPTCGAPWGRIQCDHCTPVVAHGAAVRLCVAALRYEGAAAVVIRTYKDKGEQRLAETLARRLADAIFPSWWTWADAVTYVRATDAARRRRGFDHVELIARSLAETAGLPCLTLLSAPKARDQRTLGRRARRDNVGGRFEAAHDALACGDGPRRVILVDDVMTTGATLDDAARALEAAGYAVRAACVARA